ncbi:excinuclease ABC subunit UvrC [Oscillospiraceae bacterium MB08-C2-2]|nr:excinuclease ABC subunit UvrC [Oscillospiraceae bacterium MB08-C2-2]
MLERLPFLKEKAKQLPLDPGVYIMKDTAGKIIYIGKAKALRNRVSSYFRSLDKHLPKVLRMVENVHDFTTIVTSSEFEALVLECSLIKQHRPKYNILLKDDKGYHYIRVSPGPYPRITAEKQRLEDGARYFGPYTSSFVVNQTVEEVNQVFMLPACNRRFPEDFRKARPCLNYHIKRCMGLCTGKIREKQYAEIIEQALDFIDGGGSGATQLLTDKMEQAAESMDFEKAAMYRDRIRAIQRITDHQNVVFSRAADMDVVALVQNEANCCASVLKIRGHRLVDKQDHLLGEIDSLENARGQFLLGYYSGAAQSDIPRQVSMDGPCEDQELIEEYLTKQAGVKVQLHIPVRGEQLQLVRMASANAAQMLAHKIQRTGKELSALDELSRLLGLAKPPIYIEAYDISNMGSDTVVAGMVTFENGRPLKSGYRKFNIKTIEGTDDYGSMREVLFRRLSRYEEEKASGEGFGRLPDLILLDGGKGHVAAIQPILEQFGLQVPLFGMVKDDKHRTRAIARDGGEISILSSRSAFTLVSKIQDEVHRFSITHMKSRHTSTAFELKITQVPSIGPKRAAALYKHFKTVRAIEAADEQTLAEAPGMTKAAAAALYEFLHGGQ